MADVQNRIKAGYHNYPKAKEGPNTGYENVPGSNPVLRGLPLAIAGSAVANLGLLSSFLWGNAGFSSLRKLDLDDYDQRYDPAVIPIDDKSNPETVNTIDPPYTVSSQHPNRHYSISDYHSAFKAGKLTPLAVAEALLDLADAPEHKAAFLSVNKDSVIEAAIASTQRFEDGKALGMFDGVPVAVKDEVDLRGHKKTLGSNRDFTNAHDATSWCVQKWQDAGAVIVGKLNMHELGLDTTNNNPTTGTPLNPHNPSYYTGGSSGGSAYAVATGLLPVTLGADGGGSIRIPSAYCGIYGLKPSHARVSDAPTSGLASSCGVIGPMAANMADLEYAYRIMATPDPSDTLSSQFPHPVPSTAPLPPEKKVIGMYRPYFDVSSPSVLSACDAALSHYTSAGYTIIPITLPHLPQGQLAHAMTILGEISTSIPSPTGLNAANKILLSVGKHTPVTDFFLAQKLRNLLMQHLSFLFQKYPGLLIVTPTTPNAGWRIKEGEAELKHGISDANMSLKSMTYVWMANLLGCPSLSIPIGKVKPEQGEGKIPVGLMAMAEWGEEEQLFEWGRVGEQCAWKEGEEKIGKPGGWVDVMEEAKGR